MNINLMFQVSFGTVSEFTIEKAQLIAGKNSKGGKIFTS
jgi:hypothetical protein